MEQVLKVKVREQAGEKASAPNKQPFFFGCLKFGVVLYFLPPKIVTLMKANRKSKRIKQA